MIFPTPGEETGRAHFIGARAGITLNLNSTFGIVAEPGIDLSSRNVVTPRACSQPSPNSFCFGTGPESIFIYEFLTGLRVSKRGDKIDPFVQVLVGPLGGRAGGFSDSGHTVAFGGGLDLKAAGPLQLRVQVENASKRVADRWSNDIQVTIGPIFRFGSR
jgi:hypothetical protein